MTITGKYCEDHELPDLCANPFPLRILWPIYSEELGDGRSDIDVVHVLQRSSLEVRAGGIEDGLHLGDPWIMAMLSEKRRRLKEIAYGCSCAGAEVQVIAGDRND